MPKTFVAVESSVLPHKEINVLAKRSPKFKIPDVITLDETMRASAESDARCTPDVAKPSDSFPA